MALISTVLSQVSLLEQVNQWVTDVLVGGAVTISTLFGVPIAELPTETTSAETTELSAFEQKLVDYTDEMKLMEGANYDLAPQAAETASPVFFESNDDALCFELRQGTLPDCFAFSEVDVYLSDDSPYPYLNVFAATQGLAKSSLNWSLSADPQAFNPFLDYVLYVPTAYANQLPAGVVAEVATHETPASGIVFFMPSPVEEE